MISCKLFTNLLVAVHENLNAVQKLYVIYLRPIFILSHLHLGIEKGFLSLF